MEYHVLELGLQGVFFIKFKKAFVSFKNFSKLLFFKDSKKASVNFRKIWKKIIHVYMMMNSTSV